MARLDEIGAEIALKYNQIWKNKQEAAQGWKQLEIAAKDVYVKEYGIDIQALVTQRGQNMNYTLEGWKTEMNTYTQKLINNQNIQMKMKELGFEYEKMDTESRNNIFRILGMIGAAAM